MQVLSLFPMPGAIVHGHRTFTKRDVFVAMSMNKVLAAGNNRETVEAEGLAREALIKQSMSKIIGE